MFVTVVSMVTVFVYTLSAGMSKVSVLPSALSVRSAPTAVAAVRQSAAAYQKVPFIVFWIVIARPSYLIKMLTPILMRGPTSPTSQSPASSP